MANRKSKKRTSNDGRSLELTVVRIQKMLDPLSVVEHDVELPDYRGHMRQFDVVIRGAFGGRPMLGVIECKDHKRKKGISDIEAFASKCDSVGANMRLFVSRMGFSKSSLVIAKDNRIDCMSVLDDPATHGVGFGNYAYARFYNCTGNMTLRFKHSEDYFTGAEDFNHAIYDGNHLVNFFLELLHNRLDRTSPVGLYIFSLELRSPITVSVFGRDYVIEGIESRFHRHLTIKRRWLNWIGDGYFNWHNNQIEVPITGCVVSSAIPLDANEWQVCKTGIPPSQGMQFIAEIDPEPLRLFGTGVPPLDTLGEMSSRFESE